MTLFIGPYFGKVTGQQKMFRLACDSVESKFILDTSADKNPYSLIKNLVNISLNISKINSVYITVSRSRLGFFRDLFYSIIPILFTKPLIAHLHGSDLLEFYLSENRIIRGMINFFYCKCSCHIGLIDEMKKEFSFTNEKIPYYTVLNTIV